MPENLDDNQEEIFSKVLRAGRRTYFFDVRATKADDYFLTITESKKIFDDNGNHSFKKHKIFLYKEDFEKFQNALADTLSYIIKNKGLDIISTESEEKSETKTEEKSFTDVNFEDI